MFMTSYTNQLIERAVELYDHKAEYYRYAGEFSLSELIILWEYICENAQNGNTPFDKEVKDALHLCYNYFDRHKAWLARRA